MTSVYAPPPPRLQSRKKGLLLVPEFPYDSFWSYRYIIRMVGRRAAFPPLGLLTFAAYLPDDWDLELVDLNVRVPSSRKLRSKMAAADAVFVSAMSIQKRSLVDLLGTARGLDTPFVLGGPLASSYRNEILDPHTDSDRTLFDGLDVLVWGEADASIDTLLGYLDSAPKHSAGPPRVLIPEAVAEAPDGSRAYLNDRSLFRPLDDVPLPRWDLIRVGDYEAMMIQTTAGCPFRCEFCDIIQFNGGFNRPKSPASVRRELEAILATGYRGGVFSVDDNFIGMPAAISKVLDAMTEFQREHGYPFSFLTQASVNLGTPKLEHLIGKMRVAGFNAVFLGIETPDEDALRSMNKKQNLKVDVPALVARLQSEGLEVYAGFIFGNDGDTPSTADRIIEFVRSTRIFTAMAGILTPVPHTPLYARLEREGRLRPAEFSGNNTDDEIQFEPSAMTAAELRQGMHRILAGLFNPAESYRRGLDMLRAIRPHIFAGRRLDLGYLRGAAMSFWKQGVRRLDRRYFGLLWQAFRMDHQLYRNAAGGAPAGAHGPPHRPPAHAGPLAEPRTPRRARRPRAGLPRAVPARRPPRPCEGLGRRREGPCAERRSVRGRRARRLRQRAQLPQGPHAQPPVPRREVRRCHRVGHQGDALREGDARHRGHAPATAGHRVRPAGLTH
jgi:radical SAM superfamily enzyme YgiQ (UPF0313 family)